MAKSNVQVETVKTVVGVTLNLSEAEAVAVQSVLGRVGGTGEGRTLTDGVYRTLTDTLTDAGVDVATYRTDHPFYAKHRDNMLTFPNKSSGF